MRYRSPIAVALAAALLTAGCGGSGKDHPKAALGTPQNPMVARAQPAAPLAATPEARRKARELAAADAAAADGGSGTAAASPSSPSALPGGSGTRGSRSSRSTTRRGTAAAAAEGEPTSGAGATPTPNYQDLPSQRAAPTGRAFSPCNLVSQSRAETILGGAIQTPLEAQQGPTCIYRTKKGAGFVTVAVQQVAFARLRGQLREATSASVAGRAAYCATLGRPTLYVPLGRTRLLTISAPCRTATAFAQVAVPKLAS